MKEISTSELNRRIEQVLGDLGRGESYLLKRYKKVVGVLTPPPSHKSNEVPIEDVRQKAKNFKRAGGNLQETLARDKARRELLSKINKKS